MQLVLLLLATTTPASADEGDCAIRTWPADGATDVSPDIQFHFMEAVGETKYVYETEVFVDGTLVRADRQNGMEWKSIPQPVGPGSDLQIRIRWGHEEAACERVVSFSTASEPVTGSDFSGLQIDEFDVDGGRYPSVDLSGSLAGDGNQIVMMSTSGRLRSTWVVPTVDEPAFEFYDLADDATRVNHQQCATLQTYSPSTGREVLDEVCGRGCSSLPGSPAPWALALAGLALLWRRRA